MIFYAASLLIIMASLNQTVAKEIHGVRFDTVEFYLPGPQSGEVRHLAGGWDVPGRLIEMDLASR